MRHSFGSALEEHVVVAGFTGRWAVGLYRWIPSTVHRVTQRSGQPRKRRLRDQRASGNTEQGTESEHVHHARRDPRLQTLAFVRLARLIEPYRAPARATRVPAEGQEVGGVTGEPLPMRRQIDPGTGHTSYSPSARRPVRFSASTGKRSGHSRS